MWILKNEDTVVCLLKTNQEKNICKYFENTFLKQTDQSDKRVR